eukprot:3040137-Rhodomonas_salina.3
MSPDRKILACVVHWYCPRLYEVQKWSAQHWGYVAKTRVRSLVPGKIVRSMARQFVPEALSYRPVTGYYR